MDSRICRAPRAVACAAGLAIACRASAGLPAATAAAEAGTRPAPGAADWLRDAGLGVFMHFWANTSNQMSLVESFDAPAVARQVKAMGARYFVLTLGQNAGFYNAPNAVYDRFLGIGPGERCSKRDLPRDLHGALEPEGIRLMLYLPCQVPNRDPVAQRAFGLPEGPKDQPVDGAFARKWAEVIHEWSARYGDKVAGWWFDGGYAHIGFNDAIAAIYADAVKRGNPRAIVTFNPGVRLVRHTKAEDYTAGELNDPFGTLPAASLVDGSQWHALTFLGSSWGRRDTRHPTERWVEWAAAAVRAGGAVTLDLGPNTDPAAGPVGTFSEAQAAQVRAIAAALNRER